MTLQAKVTGIWLICGLCLMMYSSVENTQELFFQVRSPAGISTPRPIPLAVHMVMLVSMVLPVLMAFLTLLLTRRWFLWTSMIVAFLLFLLNAMHWYQVALPKMENVSIFVILTLVLVPNGWLIVLLNRWRKSS